MNNIDRAIQYYMEYESHNRLNSVEIPKDAMGLDYSYVNNLEKLRNHINLKVKSEITFIFDYEMKYLNGKARKSFLDALFEIEKENDLQTKEYLEELLKTHGLCTSSQTESRINRVIELIKDKYITILSPLYSIGEKNMHLIGFKCFIEDDVLRVEEFRINRGVLEKLMLTEVGFGIEEVLGGFEATQEVFSNIHELKFYTYCEAMNALSSTLTEMFPLIKKQLNEGYKRLVLISLEGLSELYYPPFKDDMKLLSSLNNRHDSKLLSKYLLHNENMSKDASEIHLNSHYGSYTDVFAVNEKQWVVISGTHQSEILAVSGPPGTGKTTLLKELIADLSVNRTRRLIDAWEKDWELWRQNDNGVYSSPFGGANFESIVVTSTNNEAVNNIGVEITKDIRDLRRELHLKLDLDFSAKLGKKDNRIDFYRNNLTVLMKDLDELTDGIDVSKEIEEFQDKISKIDETNKCIASFLEKRKALNELNLIFFEEDKLSIEKMSIYLEKIKIYISDLEVTIKIEMENALSVLKSINLKLDTQSERETERRKLEKTIRSTEDELDLWLNKRAGFFSSKLINLFKTFGSLGNYIINKMYGDIVHIETEIMRNRVRLKSVLHDIQEIENDIDELRIQQKSLDEKIKEIEQDKVKQNDIVERFNVFFDAFNDLSKIIGTDIPTVCERLEYKLYNAKPLYILRHRLFKLSLIINEAYIIKNRASVKNNLNFILDDEGKVMQSFFRSNYKYDKNIENAIRQIWETFCMCYPVITTTLHSFSRDNFHMLDNLFDYMLVDEAGQIMPYYLLAPLYRCKNAVIVGDEKQLEPIRDAKNKVFEKYVDTLSGSLDANKATAQGLANLATDFYEKNKSSGNVVYEGIMLEEHRRCEKSIVQFSNKYVYDNRMIVPKEDEIKEFLESNVCFIDIRGVKESNNTNLSEVKAVAILVRKLLDFYKEEDIAVIAPYKNQVRAIEEALDNNSVKVGTVHSFQGKDKEVVIMSMNISSESDMFAKRFIGSKPNMLNVAFTRSKQQLFIVGNYSVLENCESTNYLYKAGEFVKNHGTLFSIYESDSLDKLTDAQYNSFIELMNQLSPRANTKFEKIFRPYLNDVNILEDKYHYLLLMSLFENADSSVSVVCPWVTKSVIKDEFIENIKNFKAAKKDYNIVFGYKNSKDTLNSDEEISSIIKRDNQFAYGKNLELEMKQLVYLKEVMGENLKYRPPLHTKALIVDNEYLLIGSHNWLSKQGQKKGDREEMTVIIQDEGMIEYILKKYGIV